MSACGRLVAGDVLEGENGYRLDTGETVDGLKRVALGALPHTLIVQLKRFEFDFDRMVKVRREYLHFVRSSVS